MKSFTIFNLIIAAIASIALVAGALIIEKSRAGYWILYTGIFLAIIFSITSIIDLLRLKSLSQNKKTLWLILVVSVPVLGGLLFYLIHFGRGGDVIKMTRDS